MMRLTPADLTELELAARARLEPRRHVVMLTNGGWYSLEERHELGGVATGFRGASLLSPEGVSDEDVSFELCHIVEYVEAWELVRVFERSAEATRRARARERWKDNWTRPVFAARMIGWMRGGDARAREPEWKRRRRAWSKR